MSIRRSISLPVRFSPLLAVALAALPALAAEGRIPVAAPMIIAASGKYIVTNNLLGPGPGGPVITIMAPDVDLDLNGFVLTGGPVGAVISAPAGAGGADHVRIHNGTVVGGTSSTSGIDVAGGAPCRKVDIEDVKIHDTPNVAIHLGTVPAAVIRNTEIVCSGAGSSFGIRWDGGGTKTGTIENNVMRACSFEGINIFQCSSVAIVNNRITGSGIILNVCNGSLVAENTVEEASGGGILLANSSGNKLFDNVVTRSCTSGIELDPTSNNNLVLNNNSSGNVSCFGVANVIADGIRDQGAQNVIQGNVLNSNKRYGLSISGPGGAPPAAPAVGPPGCGNTYGGNTARGNFGAAPVLACAAAVAGQGPPGLCIAVPAACVLPAPPNTSFGNNLMPGPPPG